ncbi:UDP-2,3-diacylglucosamine diphosphatase [soil metagenome]
MQCWLSVSFEAVKAWFVSDIHITGPEDVRLARFEAFLRARLGDGTTHVFLVGDIFDLWVGGDSFFSNRYAGVIAAVRDLRAKSIDVLYFEGNHDLHLAKIWSEQLGCRVFTEPRYFDLGSYRVRVEHGDQMNPADTGYLILRAALRTSVMEWLSDALPGRFVQKIGNGMSRSSRKWTSSSLKARNEAAIREMIHSHAKRVYKSDEAFDFIFSGHVHVRDDFSWKPEEGAMVRSINLGWWTYDEPSQAYCLTDSGGQWLPVETST